MTERKCTLFGRNEEIAFSPACINENGQAFSVSYRADIENGKTVISGSGDILSDTIVINKINGGYAIERRVKNLSAENVNLKEVKITLSGIDFGGRTDDDYFYANENPRLYGVFTLPIEYDRLNPQSENNRRFGIVVDTKYADPGAISERVLVSPYSPFPAILIGNYSVKEGLVIGSLSQDVFYHNYRLSHADGKITAEVFSSFKCTAYRILKPSEELVDKLYIGKIDCADDINSIFSAYLKELSKHLRKPLKKCGTNRKTVAWDSWNDGVFRDVSEDILVKEAKAVKANFPAAEWFQLDDGYSSFCMDDVDACAHGLGVAYEREEGVDKRKFPNGLKGYTEKIKKEGLRPAIWIGGFCPHATKIYREHPEWFIDYSFRTCDTSPLDVSKEAVRDYMAWAMKYLLKDNGFEGIKHDFWTYAFEDGNDLYENKEKSGYEYRRWWLNEIRKNLPEDGYLETGCDLAMGNPFWGEFIDNYRFGLDVQGGVWDRVKTTMFWSVAACSVHTGEYLIPNGDSIGLMKGLSDLDFTFLLNLLLITHSLVEISGLYSNPNLDKNRLATLKRAVNGLDNGADAYYAKFDYREKNAFVPRIVYSVVPCFADVEFGREILRTVAVFNESEEDITVEFTGADVGLKEGEYTFTDVWNKTDKRACVMSAELRPHESRLYYVNEG